MATYDYIILGAGASGLLLAYRMSQDAFYADKSILIIDRVKEKGNDRTWCYWEEGKGEWDALMTKSWPKIFFGCDSYSKTISILPYHYKMIRSEDFYNSLWSEIDLKSNITFLEDTVVSFTELNGGAQVITQKGAYQCLKLFNSVPNPKAYKSQMKYPVLQQHFVGWFVKTKEDIFDDSLATFMDFSIPQNGNTRFMYVLPMDKKTALFEYTLFSKDLLEYAEYENAIENYLNDKNITDFQIVEKEKGSIPMTSFKFSNLNSEHVLNIGTAGGWTKASTGYTFKNTTKKTKELVTFLKTETDLSKFQKNTKYRYYDLLFLDVLANHNDEGAYLFSSMFRKAKPTTILKFLDEETTLVEDLKIISSVPAKRFMQALFKRLYKS